MPGWESPARRPALGAGPLGPATPRSPAGARFPSGPGRAERRRRAARGLAVLSRHLPRNVLPASSGEEPVAGPPSQASGPAARGGVGGGCPDGAVWAGAQVPGSAWTCCVKGTAANASRASARRASLAAGLPEQRRSACSLLPLQGSHLPLLSCLPDINHPTRPGLSKRHMLIVL